MYHDPVYLINTCAREKKNRNAIVNLGSMSEITRTQVSMVSSHLAQRVFQQMQHSLTQIRRVIMKPAEFRSPPVYRLGQASMLLFWILFLKKKVKAEGTDKHKEEERAGAPFGEFPELADIWGRQASSERNPMLSNSHLSVLPNCKTS